MNRVFEVLAEGALAVHGFREDKVYWVAAASLAEVLSAVEGTGATVNREVHGWPSTDAEFRLPQQRWRLRESLLSHRDGYAARPLQIDNLVLQGLSQIAKEQAAVNTALYAAATLPGTSPDEQALLARWRQGTLVGSDELKLTALAKKTLRGRLSKGSPSSRENQIPAPVSRLEAIA